MSIASERNATAAGRVLASLYRNGRQSRSSVARTAHLARSAIWHAAKDLSALGLIEAFTPEPSGDPGRPSGDLEIRADAATVVAGALTRDGVELRLLNLVGRTVAKESWESDVAALPPAATLGRLANGALELIRESPAPVVGLGLSVPGLVNRATGVAQALQPLGWSNVAMVPILRSILPESLPLAFEHDATLGALTEHRIGAGRGADRLLYLTGERRGAGGALVTTGSVGDTARHPLQAGHLIVDPRGPVCLCGARGCFELFVDGAAMANSLSLPSQASFEQIMGELESLAMPAKALEPLVEKLGTGLISLINILSPDRVVLGGLLAPIARGYREPLEQAMKASVVAQITQCDLMASELASSQIIGAGEIAFDAFLGDPARVFASTLAEDPAARAPA
jgi:predicted NBD/HSP70 family sugar kinase